MCYTKAIIACQLSKYRLKGEADAVIDISYILLETCTIQFSKEIK